MTAPVSRNRLDEEESPYLQDHADNPVNWQPWDEQALEAAREQDKPIFLSVGYAACHWCHVMAEESFEDEEVAELLNEEFVPIKVDREERPDVDSIYQTICQRVTGRGGWPLSVWLTPDQKPFQVGTYFPKEQKRRTPGFLDILGQISDAWNSEEGREEIESRAEKWADLAVDELEGTPGGAGTPEENVLSTAAQAAVRGADREYGGWGSGPKFPQTGRLHLLLRAYEETDREVYREVATETLDAMADGGMYDHVGGGFHRYATDRDWTVPHFEKMLYDNAELPRAYLAGYQVTENERYAEVVEETLEFIQREMTHDEGAFFSTLDAQSEGESGEREEGAFYVWTPQEVEEVVDDEFDAELFCERYGITEGGNFEGRTVLTRTASPETLATRHDADVDEIEEALERGHEQVFTARAEQPRPPRDEKILAGWNGLAISAFAEAAIVLEESYADPAAEAVEFLETHLWDEDEKRLSRRYKDGVVKIDGYLEDYAFLGRGAFDLYQATGEVEYLAFAVDLARAIEREFWDDEEETLYFTPQDGESLIARPQEPTDQSTPSSMGVAAELLEQLSHFQTDGSFAEIAETVVDRQGSRIESDPLQHASLTLAADTVIEGSLELALVADEIPEEYRTELREWYLPDGILAWRPADEEGLQSWLERLGLDGAPPIWADRDQKDDEPTVYACRARTCSPPRNELARALRWGQRML
ncbi:DUF255 domain-containing protein [Halovenus sp. WSH3]|uniref:DUF255 domain-containing protein n=1 Tax=Halovenus carboxidivorans TaxID=2692199 RepID=A0A6B0TAG4_9EURY|nr:thioredoxin domain-containing protein [Halovenus carboxidivorans]MXR51870.1 DUF255 domain-containing protein [Halovenus carboxidivorans]